MIRFIKPGYKKYLNKIKIQQAMDKLRLLIESNYWNIYKPLPKTSDIAKLLDHKEQITLSAISGLIQCGVILQGLDGELYITATAMDVAQ